jgi:phosphoribosylformylglycinamidine cyclo-ligase
MCHVTGGGLRGNVPRILPDGMGVELDESRWSRPAIFDLISQRGDVEHVEMHRTFNMGLGFVLIVDAERSDDIVTALVAAGERAAVVGRVVNSAAAGEARVQLSGG